MTTSILTSPTIGNDTDGYITGSVNGDTINFVIPFGVSWGYNDIDVTFNNVIPADAGTHTPTSNLVVEDSRHNGVAGTITVTSQNDENEVTYKVNVKQEDALTYIKLGDYEGEFQLQTTGNDAGKENGTILFKVPAGTTTTDLDALMTNFIVGSAYSEIVFEPNDASHKHILVNGEEGDYSVALGNNKMIQLKNAYNGTLQYIVKFVFDNEDTDITAVSATIDSKTYDGTVDGENLEVVVPANAKLNNVSVNLVGPATLTGETAVVKSVDGKYSANFGTDGKATITGVNYTTPISLQVYSANGQVYGYYTLTITKAEAPQKNPQVTSAKVVLWPGTDNEYTATGSIDQSEDGKITFTVPYRTNDAAVKGAEYAFAKTSQTSWDSTNNPNNFANWTVKDGGKLGVASNDTDDAKVYTIVFDRMDPETGKSISNFSLSEADWEQLKPYNNNKTFDVTVSGTEFKVTLPDTNTPTSLYPDFTLSEGAALYYVRAEKSGTDTDVQADKKVNGATIKAAKVAAYDANGEGTALTHLTDGDIYVIADEKLA